MLVVLSTDQNTQFPTHWPISSFRDLGDATNPDFQVRKALAARVRDACINVGFFYGAAFPSAKFHPANRFQ